MPLINADLHVHYYPAFDWRAFYGAAITNLEATSPGAIKLIALTEREDCTFFEQLVTGTFPLPSEFSLEHGTDQISTTVVRGSERLSIVAGSQINTQERLEILALCCRERIPSKLNWEETFHRITLAGGVPIINWAPGKWWFKRGKLIREILLKFPETPLCDTSLRFLGYPRPSLCRGHLVIFGSDPLPLQGEELRVGTYSTVFESHIDPKAPGTDLKAFLRGGRFSKATGRRLSFGAFIQTMKRYYSRERG